MITRIPGVGIMQVRRGLSRRFTVGLEAFHECGADDTHPDIT